jgi:hypothetical protein
MIRHGQVKGCSCAVKVLVLIRGDLYHIEPFLLCTLSRVITQATIVNSTALASRSVQRPLLLLGDGVVTAGEYLLRGVAGNAAVVVFIVVPDEIILTPAAGMRLVVEAARVVRLVFLGLELAFAEGVVVTHPGAAVAAHDVQLAHVIQVPVRGHRRSTILVQRELPRGNGVTRGRFVHPLPGQGAVFLIR